MVRNKPIKNVIFCDFYFYYCMLLNYFNIVLTLQQIYFAAHIDTSAIFNTIASAF